MTDTDGPRYLLGTDVSTRLISERRKIDAGTPLRRCPNESGCEGWLMPRDINGAAHDPVMIPTGNGTARVLLEGRCDTCRYTFTWTIGEPAAHLA